MTLGTLSVARSLVPSLRRARLLIPTVEMPIMKTRATPRPAPRRAPIFQSTMLIFRSPKELPKLQKYGDKNLLKWERLDRRIFKKVYACSNLEHSKKGTYVVC